MHQPSLPKDDSLPAWYADLKPVPFRTFDESHANRIATRVHQHHSRTAHRRYRLTIGIATMLCFIVAGYILLGHSDRRPSHVRTQVPIPNPNVQWTAHEQQDVRFELPPSWTITEDPTQPETARDLNLAKYIEMVQSRIEILKQISDENSASAEEQVSSDTELVKANLELIRLEETAADNKRKLSEAPPVLAFQLNGEGQPVGYLRTIVDYSLTTFTDNLKAHFPAHAITLKPVEPFTDDRSIQYAQFKYVYGSKKYGTIEDHYYLITSSRTYEFAFDASLVDEATAQRIVQSFERGSGPSPSP